MDDDCQSPATHHVAEIVGLLGLPPAGYIDRSDVIKRVFDDKGQLSKPNLESSWYQLDTGDWKGAGGVTIRQISLDKSVSMLRPKDEKLFLNFVKKMLHWLPEERKRASELLEDPWLKSMG
jgi:serine/threonine-protein kinase SRPK3